MLPGTRYFLFILIMVFTLSCKHANPSKEEIETKGAEAFTSNGCHTCHSLEGKTLYGPPLDNIVGKEIEVVRGNNTVKLVITRKYIEKAILDPGYEKPAGYENKLMPDPVMTKSEAKLLIDYIILLGEGS